MIGKDDDSRRGARGTVEGSWRTVVVCARRLSTRAVMITRQWVACHDAAAMQG
jgi:hypothetical protein